jgi:hypothetical protein
MLKTVIGQSPGRRASWAACIVDQLDPDHQAESSDVTNARVAELQMS